MKIEKKCRYCGRIYYVPLYRKESSKFCSKECSYNSRKGKVMDWLVKINIGRVGWNKGLKGVVESNRKGKTWDEIYGKEVASEIKEKLSKSLMGKEPWNKGTKGVMKPNATSFKKGMIPWCAGKKMSEEFKKKLSDAWNYDKHFTEETRRKIGIAGRKKKMSEESKRKIGLSHLGKVSPRRGKNYLEIYGEGREKLVRMKLSTKRLKQDLPMKNSSIEIKIQNFLKELHIEFLTHYYISEINHSYMCDILIPDQEGIQQKTIIECDGCYWHNCPICKLRNPRKNKFDKFRTEELKERGFRVIRLWEHEIKPMKLNEFKERLECH